VVDYLKELKLPLEEYDVKVERQSVFLPSSHSPQVDEELPDAFLLLGAYREGELANLFTATLNQDEVVVGPHGLPMFDFPLPTREWNEVREGLNEFFAIAANVQEGSTRFARYFFQQVYDEQRRLFWSTVLDFMACAAWLRFEGVDVAELYGFPYVDDEAHELHAQMVTKSIAMKQDLDRLGSLDPDHLGTVFPYMQIYMGVGLVNTSLNDSELSQLPPSTHLYQVHMEGLHLRFALIDGQLKIAGIHFD
jgi:hypothetical protein